MDAEGNPQESCASLLLYALGICDMPFARVVPCWKARFSRQCVSEDVAGILTARPPKYSVILELDRKIRDVGFPKQALGPPPSMARLFLS
jgi:hypothetical protein